MMVDIYTAGHLQSKEKKTRNFASSSNQLLPNYGNLYGICSKGFKIIIPFRDSNDFCHSISQSQKHASKWSSSGSRDGDAQQEKHCGGAS